MKKSILNQEYFLIEEGALDWSKPLPVDLYLYLPKNNRVVKIRLAGSFLEISSREKFFALGEHALLSIADPSSMTGVSSDPEFESKLEVSISSEEQIATEAGSEFEGAEKQAGEAGSTVDWGTDPKRDAVEVDLGIEAKEKGAGADVGDLRGLKKVGETEFGDLLDPKEGHAQGEMEDLSIDPKQKKSGFDGEDLSAKKSKKSSREFDQEKSDAEAEAENEEVIAGKEPAEKKEKPIPFHLRAKQEVGQEDEDNGSDELSLENKKSPWGQGSDAKEANVRGKTLKEPEQEKRRIQGGAEEKEAEQRFSSSPAEEEELIRVRGQKEEKDLSEKRFQAQMQQQQKQMLRLSKDIEEIEETIISGSDEGKDFVEEERRFKQDIEQAKTIDAKTKRFSDEVQEEQKLDESERATAKLSMKITNRLRLLRGELSRSVEVEKSGKTKPEDVKQMRAEIQEKIKVHERDLMVIETLDDEEFDKTMLPEELQALDRAGLVEVLSEDVRLIKGSLLLEENEGVKILGKLAGIKAKQFGVFGEKLAGLRDQILKIKGGEFGTDPEQVRVVAGKLEKEMNEKIFSTRVANQIAKDNTALRTELKNLMGKKPKDSQERIQIENRAQEILGEISKREIIINQLDAESEVSEKELQKVVPNLKEFQKRFSFQPDNPESTEALIKAIEIMEKETIDLRVQANDVAKSLDTQIREGKNHLKEKNEIKGDGTEVSATKVHGDAAREMQAAMHALHIFQSFGYESDSLGEIVVEACLLAKHFSEELADGIRPEVSQMHRALQDGIADLDPGFQDGVRAIRLAQAYNAVPGVITGKLELDPKAFQVVYSDLLRSFDSEVDYQLLERARQSVERNQAQLVRRPNQDLVTRVKQRVGQWNQKRVRERQKIGA